MVYCGDTASANNGQLTTNKDLDHRAPLRIDGDSSD